MNRFLIWAAAGRPVLLAVVLAVGCSEAPPRTPKQTQEEARQAAEAAQKKILADDAERRQAAGSARSPGAADRTRDGEVHLPPDLPGQDEDATQ